MKYVYNIVLDYNKSQREHYNVIAESMTEALDKASKLLELKAFYDRVEVSNQRELTEV